MTRTAIAAIVLSLAGAPAGAQTMHGGAAETGAASWPWHAAASLRDSMLTGAPSPRQVLRAAEAEIALGRAERARKLLASYPILDSSLQLRVARLRAATEYSLGEYGEAGLYFTRAAAEALPPERGLLTLRAALAFERAGLRASALSAYEMGARELPALARWLAWRRARVTADPVVGLLLLDSVPEAGAGLAAETRAELLLATGDSSAAFQAFAAARLSSRAADMYLAAGDSSAARKAYYTAMASADSIEAMRGLRGAEKSFPPRKPDELLLAARAVRIPVRQAAFIRLAITRGDSSAGTFLMLGNAVLASRDTAAALRALAAAARAEGPEAVPAAFLRAQLVMRRSPRDAGPAAMKAFASRYPDHSLAARALYLAAEASTPARRVDSLFGVVIARWPADPWASEARFFLARAALLRGDTPAALEWYASEIDVQGARALGARLLIARLTERQGDTATARRQLADLARDDSLGYYGAAAREAAGLPAPFIRPTPPINASVAVRGAMAELDLLDAAGLTEEARVLVNRLMTGSSLAAGELVAVGEGLIQRGRVAQGIALGWRAARATTVNDAQVLRVIYPWPDRDLIEAEARKFEIDPYLVAAVIRQESNFEPRAVSRAGARGMMQLMPSTARMTARHLGLDWSAPFVSVADANVHVGAAHLAGLLRGTGDDITYALAAYNAGGTPVARWRRSLVALDRYFFIEYVPYPETRGYLRAVLRNRSLYQALHQTPVE